MSVVLYGYWRSSAAYRVRIALNLKGIAWEHQGVDLVNDDGQHLNFSYARVNPQKLVPALDVDGTILTQSLAIIEYLDERFPEPALLPDDLVGRAKVRTIAQIIACEIHPLNNLRVLKHLQNDLDIDQDAKSEWYQRWVVDGFEAIELLLAETDCRGVFCYGDHPTLADCCLIPQVYNARRFDIDLSPYPELRRIDAACSKIKAFSSAAPENQPDAPQN